MALDVRRLRVLREVAAHGSFSAAADSLNFTQPAISRQIATLEAETGQRLVERNARGIRLTPAGELLVEHADAILDRLQVAESQLEQLASLDGGRLRLGAFATANATLIPLAISAFINEYPRVELDLAEGLSTNLVARLEEGEVDVAVVADIDPRTAADDVELEPLMEDAMYIALPRGHALARRERLKLADFAGETWIEGRESACASVLRRAAEASGFEPNIAYESTQWLGKQGLVAAGVGVTLIPAVALASVREDIVIRSLGPAGPRRQLSIASLKCGYRSPAIEPMKAILRRVTQQHCFACDAMVDAAAA
jgi:DNA-binding transcriptional LysR family regulator